MVGISKDFVSSRFVNRKSRDKSAFEVRCERIVFAGTIRNSDQKYKQSKLESSVRDISGVTRPFRRSNSRYGAVLGSEATDIA